jgi:ribosomal protein L13E
MSSRRKKDEKIKDVVPYVYSRHNSMMIRREGRGFSVQEIKQAGLKPQFLVKLGARIDKRRRSIIEENVKALKAVAKQKRKVRKRRAKSQSSEREST